MDAAQGGEVSPNEQFVWVLWKILKGDGNDVSWLSSFFHAFGLLMCVGSPGWAVLSQHFGALAIATQA